MQSPDDVCAEYANKSTSLRIDFQTYKDEESSESYVIIEGDKNSLEFLGKLLIAQANFNTDCHIAIHPNGPGQSHFVEETTIGVQIHRLPCQHGPI
jgi:hypothetical protein